MDNYSTKEIAKLTDIAESTVRKYALLLEKKGYVFERNPMGNRVFTEQDIKVFLEFKNTSKEEKSVEDVAGIVARKYLPKPDTDRIDMLDESQLDQLSERDMLVMLVKKVHDLTDMNEKQAKFNEELLKRLEQQQNYIDHSLKERDKLLMGAIRQSQEERKAIMQLAAAKEEEEEEKKSFFARLFGK